MRNAVCAFVLPALAAGVVSLIALMILSSSEQAGFSLSDLRFALNFLFALCTIASTALLIVALPLTVLLSRMGAEHAWTYPAFGLVTGCAVSLLYGEMPPRGFDWVIIVVTGGLSGAVAGQIWWKVYRKGASAGESA